ncbi:hypothetical protein [Kibdelosporangium philippinense]|uniref:hypothetical protein n=1 Tax=Kibdelosporangium philippinense TaxID=211113 RepID=UPI003609CADB
MTNTWEGGGGEVPVIDFRLLGPVAVLRAGQPVHVPAGSQQIALAQVFHVV